MLDLPNEAIRQQLMIRIQNRFNAKENRNMKKAAWTWEATMKSSSLITPWRLKWYSIAVLFGIIISIFNCTSFRHRTQDTARSY